ncbi:hypothetical protein D918_07760 [Trichuris suis]|nr:hypothetical protein D918_07760 [Trichuris suis]
MALAVDRADLLIDRICYVCGKWRDLFAAIGLGFSTYCLYRVTQRSLWALWTHLAGIINVQKRLSVYGNCIAVIGNPGAVRNELMKRLAALGFNIILVQYRPRQNLSVPEYEYGTRIISKSAEELSTEDGARNFKKLLTDHKVGLMIDTTCCIDSMVAQVAPSKANFTELRDWYKVDSLLRMAALYTRIHLSNQPKALAVTIVYSQQPEKDAHKTSLFLQALSRSLFLTPSNGIEEQYLFPWRLSRSALGKDLLWVHDAYDKEEQIADNRYFSCLYRFWVPLPKTYARHALWSMGRPGVTTGYLPHSFLQWCIGFFSSDFTFFPKKQKSERPEPNQTPELNSLTNWAFED